MVEEVYPMWAWCRQDGSVYMDYVPLIRQIVEGEDAQEEAEMERYTELHPSTWTCSSLDGANGKSYLWRPYIVTMSNVMNGRPNDINTVSSLSVTARQLAMNPDHDSGCLFSCWPMCRKVKKVQEEVVMLLVCIHCRLL